MSSCSGFQGRKPTPVSFQGINYSWLCHPDERKSCGACCGLYNYLDHSREALEGLLEARTLLFQRYPLTPEGLAAYKEEARGLHHSPPLCNEIARCEFLGFVDDERRKVGCLLHPALHGEDLRELSPYGRDLCAEHLCPSHQYLTEGERRLVAAVLDDWYLYGLVITDLDLVRESLKLVADRVGCMPSPEDLRRGAFKRALAEFLSLKEHWPFRDSRPRLGKYWFSRGEYRLDHPFDDPWDRLLCSLETDPSQWGQAMEFLQGQLERVVGAYLREDDGLRPLGEP